jgi:hypothetical protein
MARKRGRRSTRRDAAELQAEIQAAIVKWDALSPEEKMRAGSRDLHSTPGPRKSEPRQRDHMDSSDLTAQQAAIIRDRLIPLAQLLGKWERRMWQREFPPGDRLKLATTEALASVSELTMRFHRIADPSPLRLSDRPTEGERRSRKDG